MIKKNIITVPQLFMMLFISRIIINITYNPLMTSGDSMWDHILSSGISFLLTFILVIPVYLLYKQNSKINILDNFILLFKKTGNILIIIYAIYFLTICCYNLSLFDMFVSNAISPNIQIFILTFSIVLVSCYGAYKGLEGIVRTSMIIFFIIILSTLFLLISLIAKIDILNFTPLMYDGPDQVINGVFLMVSRTSCISVIAVLFPFVKGNMKKGIIFWNIGVYLTVSIFIIVLVGSLGEYIKAHIFPVYAATSIAEIGIFKRLDSLYLGIFLLGIFVKISLYLHLISLCFKKIFNPKIGTISIFISGIIIIITSSFISNFNTLGFIFTNSKLMFIFTIIIIFIIPLIILICNYLKRGKKFEI